MSLTEAEHVFGGIHEDALNDLLRAFFTARPRHLRYGSLGFVAGTTVNAGGAPRNDAAATSVSIGPGQSVSFATNWQLGGLGAQVDLNAAFLSHGSARILATSKKIMCTAFLADKNNYPPTSMTYLTIIAKTKQKAAN